MGGVAGCSEWIVGGLAREERTEGGSAEEQWFLVRGDIFVLYCHACDEVV